MISGVSLVLPVLGFFFLLWQVRKCHKTLTVALLAFQTLSVNQEQLSNTLSVSLAINRNRNAEESVCCIGYVFAACALIFKSLAPKECLYIIIFHH